MGRKKKIIEEVNQEVSQEVVAEKKEEGFASLIKSCMLCMSEDVKQCSCGYYYCEIHMRYHQNYICKNFGKKNKKRESMVE